MELSDQRHAMEVNFTNPNFDPKPSHEAKIRELLRNIASIELKLYSHGCKEFIKLLKGSSGGELLHEYVPMSANFTELLEVWNRQRGKPGMNYVMSLISTILSHREGLYRADDHGRVVVVSRVLDKFAKLIVEEKLDDVYKEINSKEGKRQKAVLLLLAAIVRRGSLLAAEVAKCFDFKNSVLFKLAEYRRKKLERKRKYSTRGAFIEFAMSFLEAGKPALLRWVLQQREIFSGILRGLGNDDEETVVYVLSTLRDRVLAHESLVPPGLRSVLFGSVTLEQLVGISAREEDVVAAKLAYEVLLMVCSDPLNGLMPDLKRQPSALKGNPKRLVDLLKKLRATEIGYHESLLLAVVNGRPSLASTYLDQFPYNLDDHTSATWLSAVTLAANVISAVRGGISWDLVDSHGENFLAFEAADVQSILKCICFRPFSRLVVNKGLLHSGVLIRHGTLRLLLEVLKLLSSFIDALSSKGSSSIKQKVQDEVRILLPDPQVLFTLLSSVSSIDQKSGFSLKRTADSGNINGHEAAARKKTKTDIINEDIDIVVGGLDYSVGKDVPGDVEKQTKAVSKFESDNKKGQVKFMEIWSCNDSSFTLDFAKDAEVYFYCKVLESLKIYHRTFRGTLEVSYDFLKILPANPLKLPSILLQSLLSMLIEHLGCSQETGSPATMQPSVYKHLQSFLSLLIHSPFKHVREQAYVLSKAAMNSTGAFDHNQCEIGSWFLFLPVDEQYIMGKSQEGKLFPSLASSVVSFLCDAVSTVGNNLVKYWDVVKCQDIEGQSLKETDVNFSPLVACVLEKCLRLLGSESETFSLPEKSLISLYVCTTLKYLLQTQIDAGVLAAVVHQISSERIKRYISSLADIEDSCCEWRPMISLYLFSKSILDQETYDICFTDEISWKEECSLANTLGEVKKLLSAGSVDLFGISNALYSTMACTNPGDVVDNLPSILAVSEKLPGFNRLVMNYMCLDKNPMRRISKLWSDMLCSGLKICVSTSSQLIQHDDGQPSRLGLHNNFEDLEYASVVFGSLLKEAPFYVLFPGIIFCGLEHHSEIKDLLVAKVANLGTEHIVSSLRLVLFWSHQIQISYRKKPSKQLAYYSELCSLFVEHILALFSSLEVDSGSSADKDALSLSICLQEVAKTVFCHPVLTVALSTPFDCPYELTKEFMGNISEGLVHFSGGICDIEKHMLKLLITTSDYILALCSKECLMSVYKECKGSIFKLFRNFVQRVFLIFKRRFKLWCGSGDMIISPILCAVVALMRFVSPIDLLELADWMFIELSDSMNCGTSHVSPSSMALCIACGGLSILLQYIQSSFTREATSDLFWKTKLHHFDATLFKSIYLKAFSRAMCIKADLSTCIKNDFADLCLLKSLKAAQSLIHRQDCIPLSMEITRVIVSTPLSIISHCLQKTDITRAKVLLLLSEMSVLHSSVFGQLFSDKLSEGTLPVVNMTKEICSPPLSEEACLMLMPAAVSYIDFSWTKFREHSLRNTQFVMAFYAKLLLNSFLAWREFVSKTVFLVECEDIFPCSVERLHDLFNDSLLLKAVHLLQCYFISNKDNKDKRWNLLCSLCPDSIVVDDFIDLNIQNIDSYSVGELTNLINRVVAKISLCYVLLFSESNKKCSPNADHDMEWESFVGSNNKDKLTMRFLKMLVGIWQQAVKNCQFSSNDSKLTPNFLLLRCLEVFTIRCICRVIRKMHSVLVKMDSLPFITKMMKVSLIHRFGDPTTLRIIRHIFSFLSDGNLPIILFLQLLLGHSQLASTVGIIDSSASISAGITVKPISGFLKLNFPTEKSKLEISERYKCRLEVLKLLRLLFHLGTTQFGSVSEEDLGVKLKEFSLLLLTSYNASLSDVDLEIFSLVSEIESSGIMGKKVIADQDYLWGSSLREGGQKHLHPKNDMTDAEEDRRRSCFRDNFPIDSKLLVQTVFNFPFSGRTSEKSLFTDDINFDEIRITQEGHSTDIRRIECYDPKFILPFSIHSLSMGFLDPVEFAGLGLLAVAFVSMGSPEDEIRKFAYEVVGRFKDALMSCQKKREVTRLKLLMSFIQNGIEEPWQRVPTILAMFVAEASVILLDPLHDHYSTISRLLMESPRMNLKSIPLFPDMFWSSSVNFKTERMWMLRLLYVGIVSEDDALIYIRNSVLEILLSVYASPLSDSESKELILLVVKKCVEVQKMACYLVENCCLISWLSSVLSLSIIHANYEDAFSSKQIVNLLQVVHETISSRSTIEWLQKHSLEQLSDLSCQLWNLLISCSKFAHKSKLVNLLLESIIRILKLSHELKSYRPPLTLSMRSLYQLCEAIDVFGDGKSGDSAQYGLRAILMCVPSTTIFDLELEELSKFLMWAVSTAVEADVQQSERQTFLLNNLCFEGENAQEFVTSTLLRWLVASVILWRVSFSYNGFNPKFCQRKVHGETLLSLIEHVGRSSEQKVLSRCKEILAATIFHLYQLLGMKCHALPSVVSALSMLLLTDGYAVEGDLSCEDTWIDLRKSASLLWSKIYCPPEANPSWRWSFYEPWVDHAINHSDVEKMDERHACQKLLTMICGLLGKTSSDSELLSPQDLESSGIFEWEKTIFIIN